MIYLRSIILIILAFALHLGSTSLVHVGWPPQPLVLLAVLLVWLDRAPAIGRVILPAGLLIDLVQPAHFPIVTLAVLTAWLVAALVQRQWLTNHSLASLFGLALLGTVAAAIITAASLWLAAVMGASATAFGTTWSIQGLLKQLGIEVMVISFAGLLLRGAARFFHQKFLYASR